MEDSERRERILSFAREREDIRLVLLSGSRANPAHGPDRWSDWDLFFVSDQAARYDFHRTWMGFFGDLLISQVNGMSAQGLTWKIFLLQYADGFRLDAQFVPLEALPHILKDSLCAVLLDKDGMLPKGLEPSEGSYLRRRPEPEAFLRTVNEFWWCVLNVAKGLARGELCYATFMHESVVRAAFLDIMAWHASSLHGWKANPGKHGRFLPGLLTRDMEERLRLSYAGPGAEGSWVALMGACDMVSEVELSLRMELGIPGKPEQAARILALMERMRRESLSGGGRPS